MSGVSDPSVIAVFPVNEDGVSVSEVYFPEKQAAFHRVCQVDLEGKQLQIPKKVYLLDAVQNEIFLHGIFSHNITSQCTRTEAALCGSAKDSFNMLNDILLGLKKQQKSIYLDFDLQVVIR